MRARSRSQRWPLVGPEMRPPTHRVMQVGAPMPSRRMPARRKIQIAPRPKNCGANSCWRCVTSYLSTVFRRHRAKAVGDAREAARVRRIHRAYERRRVRARRDPLDGRVRIARHFKRIRMRWTLRTEDRAHLRERIAMRARSRRRGRRLVSLRGHVSNEQRLHDARCGIQVHTVGGARGDRRVRTVAHMAKARANP